jgi:hypothetical protein
MKLSISVPDDLWASVQTPDAVGPSDIVQRALREHADQLRRSARPLANAPIQNDPEIYEPDFTLAVEAAAGLIHRELDNGYRLGLLIAVGLATEDLAVLETPEAARDLQAIARGLGPVVPSVYSWGFQSNIEAVLRDLIEPANDDAEKRAVQVEILGDWVASAVGVTWEGEGRDSRPILSDTYVKGALNALRDVRDEALRRIRSADRPRAQEPAK